MNKALYRIIKVTLFENNMAQFNPYFYYLCPPPPPFNLLHHTYHQQHQSPLPTIRAIIIIITTIIHPSNLQQIICFLQFHISHGKTNTLTPSTTSVFFVPSIFTPSQGQTNCASSKKPSHIVHPSITNKPPCVAI